MNSNPNWLNTLDDFLAEFGESSATAKKILLEQRGTNEVWLCMETVSGNREIQL